MIAFGAPSKPRMPSGYHRRTSSCESISVCLPIASPVATPLRQPAMRSATFSSFTSCNPAIPPSCNLRSPPERHLNWLLNIGDLVALITAASAFREPVSVLQHADHGLHLLAVDLRRILLRV